MEKQKKDIFNEGRKIAEEISSVMMDNLSEREHLDKWLCENDYSSDVVERLSDGDALTNICKEFKQDKSIAMRQMAQELKQKSRKRLMLRIGTSAAAAIAVISFLLFYENDKLINNQNVAIVPIQEKPSVKPLLITDSGEQVDLSKNSKVADGRAEAKNDTLTYSKLANHDPMTQSAYNKLILPEKYTYVVTLSDGTKVSLNSNSTLEYPTVFSGEKREVILKGEAYFEVEKDTGKPFIVKTGSTSIKVYGTKFNVNSYDPHFVKTALISGLVGVTPKNKNEVMIQPGQMLTLNVENSETKFSEFNVNKYEAWKAGFFRCDKEEINVILEDISNWYGVTFEYEFTESKHITLSASISREEAIDEVLQLLTITSGVKFKKKGEKNYTVR